MNLPLPPRPSGTAAANAAAPAEALPSSAELARELQRKLLLLACALTGVFGAGYVVYFLAVGNPLASSRGVLAVASSLILSVFGLRTGRYKIAINAMCILLFVAFGAASYLQDGVYSPSLWWMTIPPIIVVLSGSVRLGAALFGLYLAHVGLLSWHGPGSWGTVSLMASDRNLQMTFTLVFATTFIALFVGLGLHWIRQLQTTLERARASALEAAEVKARFLSNMSHEIRTPLNGMIGATEMLRSHRLSELQQRQLAAVQEQSAKMLMSLVNDILDFSKLEAGKTRIAPTPTPLQALVFDINELFSVSATERGIELTSSCDANVPHTLMADAPRLRQIVSNLVSNAVKFTEHGGVHIHLALAGDAATATAPSPGAVWVSIAVSDSGPGIAADQIPLLYRPFEQGDGSITRRYGGTGLGLSISQQLAQLMGGRIVVQSQPGQGSCFTLLLPLAQLDDDAAAPAPVSATLPGRLRVVTRSTGLWRHLQCQLAEIGQPCDTADQLPSAEDAQREGITAVLVDAALLHNATLATPSRLRALAANVQRLAVLAPLGGSALVDADMAPMAVLYKPVRRSSLHEFVLCQEVLAQHRPMAQPLPAQREGHAPQAPAGPRVLVVDDNPVNQIVTQAMLNELDASVLTASNGLEALDLLATTPVDVILMDVQMAGMDGITATRQLRERERLSGSHRTPVIAMTANSELADGHACTEAGMDAFLPKPFHFEQLRALVQAHALPATALPPADPI